MEDDLKIKSMNIGKSNPNLTFRLRGPSQMLRKLKMNTISDVRQSQRGYKRRKLRGNLEGGSAQPSLSFAITNTYC
jgi:hypothetical protein